MVDKNDAAFRELEDEMRRERFAALWHQYGIYVILFAAAIVIGVAGSQLWQTWSQSRAEAVGTEYETAVALAHAGKTEEAIAAFGAISETGPKGFATLARLSEASAYLKQNRRAEAFAIFDRLAEDRSTDPLLANLARLQAASLRLGEADFTEMENRLKPLLADGNAWRFRASELLATAALSAGKLDEARALLTPLIADPNLSRGASERIDRLMSGIAAAELGGTRGQAATGQATTSPAPAAATTPAENDKNAETPASAP
ncbi:MAG TPA: tetratricopeptide repeat protein [Hyphomicrobium sp.]|nr:tetratricopeptide repeat protein [Hyphomicrobium sp.]